MNPGDVVGDRFEIGSLAGAGGMGSIYVARDRQTGRSVAIKVLHDDRLRNSARFEREARLLADLDHPSIVRYVAQGETPAGRAYLAMEWLEGEDLEARLERGGLGVAESVELGIRIGAALGHAHGRGVIHRDLKPSNIFLVGGAIQGAKLVDFGIARLPGATVTETGAFLGTVGYMAPEQARGDRDVDARVDVFTLGAVLFRCLTGRSAFDGPNPLAMLLRLEQDAESRPRALRPAIPPALDDLIARMLSRPPAGRPGDGNAVVRELEALRAAHPGGFFEDGAVAISGPSPAAAGSSSGAASSAPWSSASKNAGGSLAFAPTALSRARGRPALAIAGAAAGAAVVIAILLAVRFATHPEPTHAAAPPPAQAPPGFCPADFCEPFTVAHPEAVDLKDLLPRVTAFARKHEPGAKLRNMSANDSLGGAVDLRLRQPPVTFWFAFVHRPGARDEEHGGITVSFMLGMIMMTHLISAAIPAPTSALREPGCSQHAAWERAVRAGMTPTGPTSFSYDDDHGIKTQWTVFRTTLTGTQIIFLDAADCSVTIPFRTLTPTTPR